MPPALPIPEGSADAAGQDRQWGFHQKWCPHHSRYHGHGNHDHLVCAEHAWIEAFSLPVMNPAFLQALVSNATLETNAPWFLAESAT